MKNTSANADSPLISKAKAEDVEALVRLVNSAYRGESSQKGWTSEEHLLGGQRTDAEMIRQMLPGLFVARSTAQGPIEACFHLEKEESAVLLGLLTVEPHKQNAGWGRQLLSWAENFVRTEWRISVMRMTVVSLRSELIAYYERRGYHKTGAKKDFPHGDPRFGLPKRTDFHLIFLEKAL